MNTEQMVREIKKDGRFDCQLEWCGAPVRHHIVRFCDNEVIGDNVNEERAWEQAANWNLKRMQPHL